MIQGGDTAYSNLATAQAASLLLECLNSNPNIISISDLWPTIPIEIGEDLGTDYDDGLDIMTNWGSSTTVPSVVTKQQSGTWQIGAYIQ